MLLHYPNNDSNSSSPIVHLPSFYDKNIFNKYYTLSSLEENHYHYDYDDCYIFLGHFSFLGYKENVWERGNIYTISCKKIGKKCCYFLKIS